MTGLSFFGQVLRIIDDSLYVLPLKMQMTACSEPNAVECIGPEDGVLSIPLSSIQMKRNDIESGSLIYLSNARVVRILRGDKGSPCPRIIHCAFDSEAGLSLYHLPSLPAIPNSPSIFPSSTLVLITQRCHAKGVKEGVFSQTQMSVTTCYIRPSRKLNEQDLRASFEVLLFDGTTAAIVALLHVGTLILSAKFQQERGLWMDSNVGRTDSWLQQYTLLLSSSRRTQGSGFDGRSSATPAPASNVFIDVITDLNVGALTSSYLNAM